MSTHRILHFHLPKTGGLALRQYLVDQLGANRVSAPLGGMKLREALLKWSDLDVISGHLVAEPGDALPVDRLCITVLRDPRERFLSEFCYKRDHLNDLLSDAARQVLDLGTYLESHTQLSADEACLQLRMLHPLGVDEPGSLTLEEKLVAATRSLDLFDLVGLQEELEDFACMIDARLAWRSKPLGHVNATARRLPFATLDAADRRAVERLLGPEVELYEDAAKRFRQDRRRFIASGQSDSSSADTASSGTAAVERDRDEQPGVMPRIFGDRRCEITHVNLSGTISGLQQVMTGELIDLLICFVAHEEIEQLNVGFTIRDERGVCVFGTNSLLLGEAYTVMPGRYVVTFSMINRLGPGNYVVDANLLRTGSHHDGCYHWWEGASRFNVHAYASEHYEGYVLMDVDVAMEGRALGASWQRLPETGPKLALRSFGRYNPPLQEFLASIAVMSEVGTMGRGVDAIIQVMLRNESGETWPSSGRNPVRLSYLWLAENGDVLLPEGLRTHLAADVPAGGRAIMHVHVRAPQDPGTYLLSISLVQEQVAWFRDQRPESDCRLRIVIS